MQHITDRPISLNQVGQAEAFIRTLGIKQFRVRHHKNLARIEVDPHDLPTIIDYHDDIVSHLKTLGYTYITLDLEGYRTGAMNEVLKKREPATAGALLTIEQMNSN